VALEAARQVLEAGGRVLWLDFEDTEHAIVDRLKSLHIGEEAALERFVFVRASW
jgi:hypothetical protein